MSQNPYDLILGGPKRGNDAVPPAGDAGGSAENTGVSNTPGDFLLTLPTPERRMIQKTFDRFDAWWKGQAAENQWTIEDNVGRRERYYSLITWPRKVRTTPASVWDQPGGPMGLRPPRIRSRSSANKFEDDARQQGYREAIQGGKYGIIDVLGPLGFKLVKVLGQGGFGCACLFRMQDINGSSTYATISICILNTYHLSHISYPPFLLLQS